MSTNSRVVLFALIKDNAVLVEKRPVKGFTKLQYLIPGGTINAGESLEDALKREMMEELGLIPLKFELLTNEDIVGLFNNLLKPFIVRKWQGEIPEVILDKEDPYPLEWLDLERALKLSPDPTIKIFEVIKAHLNKV